MLSVILMDCWTFCQECYKTIIISLIQLLAPGITSIFLQFNFMYALPLGTVLSSLYSTALIMLLLIPCFTYKNLAFSCFQLFFIKHILGITETLLFSICLLTNEKS